MLYRLLPLFLCFYSFFSQAQTTDSIVRYLTHKDTVFISLDAAGNKFLEHKIQKKQTLYSLARFYGLNVEELFALNPQIKSDKAEVGKVLRISLPNILMRRYRDSNFVRWKFAPLAYKVQKGDNLYKIAKTVFHQPMDTVMANNGMKTNIIHEGDKLMVGWLSVYGIPDSLRASVRAANEANKDKAAQEKLAKELEKKKVIKNEKGAIAWSKKGSYKTEYYCLHNQATIGSTIAVTNPMKGRTLYAKVIGRIPDKLYGAEIYAVISPSAAKALGGVDEKFYAKLRYSMDKEESTNKK